MGCIEDSQQEHEPERPELIERLEAGRLDDSEAEELNDNINDNINERLELTNNLEAARLEAKNFSKSCAKT